MDAINETAAGEAEEIESSQEEIGENAEQSRPRPGAKVQKKHEETHAERKDAKKEGSKRRGTGARRPKLTQKEIGSISRVPRRMEKPASGAQEQASQTLGARHARKSQAHPRGGERR